MKKLIVLICCLISFAKLYAQNVGIGTNTPNASAVLHLNSNNKGFLLPSIVLNNSADNITIPLPATGLMVWHNDKTALQGLGVYVNAGNAASPLWRKLRTSDDSWTTSGNSGIEGAKLGNLDYRPLQFIVFNQHIGRLGGNNNILFGLNSGNNLPIPDDFNSSANVAIGNSALATATTGYSNVAIGNGSMGQATGGNFGIAIGDNALSKQANGAVNNIAIGFETQSLTTTGRDNLAIGASSLNQNVANSRSLAIGNLALQYADNRPSGISTYNTAIGHYAMRGASPASSNTARFSVAVGDSALARIGNGEGNVAIGFQALASSAGGNRNIAIGRRAGRGSGNMAGNVAIGDAALQSGIADFNIAIGDSAMSGASSIGAANNNIGIGRKALQVASQTDNSIAIGHWAMGLTINSTGLAIGHGALRNQRFGGRNLAIGNGALFNLQSTENNIAIGDSALARVGQSTESGFTGSTNIGIGNQVLYKNQLGRDNVVIGHQALTNQLTGIENTVVGSVALFSNTGGNANTVIGNAAGYNNISGSGNVFIGSSAGFNETGSNRLYIANSNAAGTDALIYGEFDNALVRLNGRLNLKGTGLTGGIDFGYNVAKGTNNGRIGYALLTANTLDIVGGGTSTANRSIKLWADGGTTITGSTNIDGFTRLGTAADAAPRVKMKKLSVTGPAINTFNSYATGITDAKIIGVNIMMTYSGTWKMPPNYTDTPGYEYNYQVQNGNVVIINKNGNSANIGGKPITILITYEE